MGFDIKGTPMEVRKVSAAMDDVLPEKTKDEKKEDKPEEPENGKTE